MFIPDPNYFHPGSEFFPYQIRIKEFKHFNPQKGFLSSGKNCMIRVVHPGYATLLLLLSNLLLPIIMVWIRGARFISMRYGSRKSGSDNRRLSEMLLEMPTAQFCIT
jgi:hypothetical protein